MPRLQLPEFLLPGWIDEARRIVQEQAFRTVLGDPARFRDRCLNAGCGGGLFAGFLESFPLVREIAHIDLQYPAFVAERTDPRHQAYAGSLTELPFASARFDCCLCTEVLEHIPDDRAAIQELARVLKPHGWLLMSVPTPPAPHDPAHVREGYSLEALRDLLAEHGFLVRQHAYDLHGIMRMTYALWQWQFRVLGRSRRSYAPRGLLRTLAAMDRRVRVGRPWNLVVLAEAGQPWA